MLTWSGPRDPGFSLFVFTSKSLELLSSPGPVCSVVFLEQLRLQIRLVSEPKAQVKAN